MTRKVLDHPDASKIIMKYLLNHDLSDFESQEIPSTKIKKDIMQEQLPNSI